MGIKLVLKQEAEGPMTPEVEKWLKETAEKIKPIFDEFFKSPEYIEFITKVGTESMIHGQASYTSKDIEGVVDKYNARVNVN